MHARDNRVPDAMSVSQLAERTGVPPRRIRFYVAEGLLQPPLGRGRASHYTTAHLERLQQIIALREGNLGLDEIREHLGDVTAEPATRPVEPSAPVTWRRWEIIPGVELHARDDLDDRTLETARVMVGAVRHVLENGELPANGWSEQDE